MKSKIEEPSGILSARLRNFFVVVGVWELLDSVHGALLAALPDFVSGEPVKLKRISEALPTTEG